MSETRCKRCNRRISDSTAQYGEKCAKLLGYRDPKNDVSGRVADVQHVAHEVIAELENLGIDWKRDVGQEMFYDMVQEEYLRILSGESNLQRLSQFSRMPPKDALSLYKELMREELRRQEKATLPGERMPERYQNGMEYSKEQILGAIPKAKQKAALLVERMPEWYQ